MVIVANPRQFKIPDWFLNRKKDYKDGRYSQVVSNALDMKLRDDLERLKKIRFAIILVWMELLLELQLNRFHSFKAMGLKLKLISLFSFVLYHWFPWACFHLLLFCNRQEPSWSPPLLGSSCPWATHQDNWPQGKDCWCLQEAMICSIPYF